MPTNSERKHRDELVEIVSRGEVVIHNGQIITAADDLPSEVELAGDDVVRKQQFFEDLERRKRDIEKLLSEGKAVEANSKAK